MITFEKRTGATMFCLVLLISVGCARNPTTNVAQQSSTPSPTPAAVTPADLAKLRWLEGSWRGTGDGVDPFYERYRFENETTLLIESFADEKMDKPTETTRYELKDGHFAKSGEGSRWVATAIDENSISFEPIAKAQNSFRFEKESANVWKATLTWPNKGNGQTNRRVYRMERITAPAPSPSIKS